MITLISFIILIAGAANWMIIGLMQYDFVAGIFGTQSSLLSRLVYIIIGFAAIWIIIMTFVQKGRIKINDNGFGSLNKIAPANKKEKNNKRNQDNQDSQNSQYENYEYSSQTQPQKPHSNHQYSHPNTVDAGSEFHNQHSNHERNPFD